MASHDGVTARGADGIRSRWRAFLERAAHAARRPWSTGSAAPPAQDVDVDALVGAARARGLEIEALAGAARALAAATPEWGAQHIADTLRALLGVGVAIVYRREERARGLIAVAASGDWSTFAPALRLGEDMGLAAVAIADGRAAVSADVLTDPRVRYPDDVREGLARLPHRAAIAVPLRGAAGIVGAIVVADRPGARFADEAVRAVEAFAAPAALALSNAALSERLRRRAARLKTLAQLNQLVSSSLDVTQVLKAVATAAAELTGARLASIWTADEDARVMRRASVSQGFALEHPVETLAFGQGGVGLVAARRAPLNVRDLDGDERFVSRDWFRAKGLSSALEVPILVGERLLGVLALFGQQPFDLAADEQEALDSFIAQAALAMRNARLYADAERRREEAEVVAELARRINESLDLPVVLETVARAARTLVRADLAHVLLHDAATDRMEFRYGVGDIIEPPASLPIDRGKGLAGGAWVTGRPQRIADHAGDPRFARDYREHLKAEHLGSVIVVPITIRGRVEGLLMAANRVVRAFSDRDEATLVGLADQAAIAISNAALLEVAQRTRAEAEEANRIKDDFLGTLSHELRTPLNAMLGWVRMLRAGALDPATAARALEIVERNTRAQAQLINDLLDVSRIVTGKMRLERVPAELPPVIKAAMDAVQSVADARQVTLRTSLDVAAGPILGDPDRLQQVVWNLLSNAIKFTPPGGRVDVRLRRDGDVAELRVTDTGQGIVAEFVPLLFERFRQADSSTSRGHRGLGLGLAIVRHLVELHGGTVRADSDGPGRGAVFTVRLPLMAAGSRATDWTPPPADPIPAAPALAGLHVVVVDDDDDARELFASVLRSAGAAVSAAPGTSEALAVLEQRVADVLVSDLSMPERDGYDLIRAVRSREAGGPPAIAVSAYAAGDEDRARALADGFTDHLVKPIEPHALVRAVALAAGRARAG